MITRTLDGDVLVAQMDAGENCFRYSMRIARPSSGRDALL